MIRLRDLVALNLLLAHSIIFSYRLSIILPIYQDDRSAECCIAALTKDPMFFQYELLMLYVQSAPAFVDNMKFYCDRYTNIQHYVFDNDPGMGALLNFGIAASSADYVTRSATNIRYSRYAFDLMMEFLDEHDWGKIVYGGCYQVSGHLRDYYEIFLTAQKKEYYDTLANAHVIGIWKKNIHAQEGMFDEQYLNCQQLFWDTILEKSHVAMFYPFMVATVSLEPEGMTA